MMLTPSHRQSVLTITIFALIIALVLSACDDPEDTVNSDNQRDMSDDMVGAMPSLDATSIEDRVDLGAQDMDRTDAGMTVTRPRFDPRGVNFFDTPWPSDARLTAQGTPDLSLFPTTYESFVKILNEIEASVVAMVDETLKL